MTENPTKTTKPTREISRLAELWEINAGQQASVTLEYTWVNCVSHTRDYVAMH